jgi:hypothetical protein
LQIYGVFPFFFFISYIMLIMSLVLYLFPVLNNFTKFTSTTLKTYFSFINSFSILPIFLVPLALITGIVSLWSAPAVSAWFGHILFTSFQYKITLFTVFNMVLYLVVFTTASYFTSREIYDYTLVTFHFFYWILLLFYSNSVFTVIFLIEVIGALLFLLIVTSTFSTSFFFTEI